ncbi:MAG: 30S ribosomal protein S15 [Candidatus Fraserbacteria bacterium RBG_16_55_9]|uniref:Small ribosomal subunit protein uS15 n=1 Tax=Fraserbacteria sp. (strain RBG_16_55_9) TaxID=1817864 RepID=A0A1F5V344_FRAXR|nr:MAG: 30S ribosomal protein S15 [Candidatus Fraserbacteria bacterium RBG_16_55_9]
MALLKQAKAEVIQAYQRTGQDTGSPEVQIAILTKEVEQLTGHLKTHKHDFHSTRGLMVKVGRRKRLLTYLKREDPEQYRKLIERLGIRG